MSVISSDEVLRLTCGTFVLQKGIPPAALTSLTSCRQRGCVSALTPASSTPDCVGLEQCLDMISCKPTSVTPTSTYGEHPIELSTPKMLKLSGTQPRSDTILTLEAAW